LGEEEETHTLFTNFEPFGQHIPTLSVPAFVFLVHSRFAAQSPTVLPQHADPSVPFFPTQKALESAAREAELHDL
jgi:hypothetical protein